jgi:two-component system alkaline phosphatase synthesis response regulator PhoP
MVMSNVSILVIEDEELIRTMIKLNLEKAGYNVTAADSAEAMLAALEERSYNLILLDIMLPGMSGPEGLGEIRKQGIQTPVMMVTAKTDTDTKVDTFDLGADDYIAKPFDMKELLARVKAMIRRSR